jgi:hypothetical protein
MAKNRFKAAAPKAKRLYKTGRYKTFADAMRAALKGGGSRKPAKAKRVSKKVSRVSRKRSRKPAARSATSLPTIKSQYRGTLNDRLKTYLFLRDRAGTKRMKRAYGKTIADIKRQLKNLS